MSEAELVLNPKTGYLDLPQNLPASESVPVTPENVTGQPAPVASKPLTQSLVPDLSNPATFTASVELGGLVLALDDWDEDEADDIMSRERDLIAARTTAEAAIRKAQDSWRVEVEKETPDESLLQSLADEIKQQSDVLDGAIAAVAQFYRTETDKRVKGTLGADGKFYPVGDARPLRTLAARRDVFWSLKRRASIGASEADFLPMR